jgi:hypothetical protein
MVRIYQLIGVITCAAFIFSSVYGWDIFDPPAASGAKPKGASIYHK